MWSTIAAPNTIDFREAMTGDRAHVQFRIDFDTFVRAAYPGLLGVATVIVDLAGGESIIVVNPAYAGRTYETMPTASMSVDRAAYTKPSSAWFLLCAARETPQPDGTTAIGAPGSYPCWLGHGEEAMREIPAASTSSATFTAR
jgi:hypothetical protein